MDSIWKLFSKCVLVNWIFLDQRKYLYFKIFCISIVKYEMLYLKKNIKKQKLHYIFFFFFFTVRFKSNNNNNKKKLFWKLLIVLLCHFYLNAQEDMEFFINKYFVSKSITSFINCWLWFCSMLLFFKQIRLLELLNIADVA